jgi:small neutral amino acid transporter SnatA (MarC family)
MNGLLLGVAYLAAVNPARTRLGLPESSTRRAHAVPAVLGSALALGAILGLAWLSGPLLEALEITPETFRIAAGLVAVAAGIAALWRAYPGEEPALPGWRAAFWPVAFPRLLAPEVAALALTTGSNEGVPGTVAAAAVVLAVVVVLAPLRRAGVPGGALAWTGRVLAVLLIGVGVFLMIDGIRDV